MYVRSIIKRYGTFALIFYNTGVIGQAKCFLEQNLQQMQSIKKLLSSKNLEAPNAI